MQSPVYDLPVPSSDAVDGSLFGIPSKLGAAVPPCKQAKHRHSPPLARSFSQKLHQQHLEFSSASFFTLAPFPSIGDAMSLPGLDLTQPSGDREFAPAPPTQISLSKGSEWRFEVAFGTTVRVKVSYHNLPPPQAISISPQFTKRDS